jgi:hypothetical protein
MTDFERIKAHFEANATCPHKQKPLVNYDPGCAFIQCSKGGACKCQMNEGDGIPISQFLAGWQERFS